MHTITIEDVEALALSLETEEATRRAKLTRLITAHARILATREPERFARKATEYGDVAGHSDNSFPPEQEYRAHNGPRLLGLRRAKTTDVPTSSGFYYSWRRVTEDGGLYVARDGEIWERTDSGTGRVGRFAAHPGDCDVEVTLEWERRSEVSLADLEHVETELRKLAFPAQAAA